MRHRDNYQFINRDAIDRQIWKTMKLIAAMDAINRLGCAGKFAKITQRAIHFVT